ncbi:hypothetical protein AAFF_G00125410 [Aldrovandia affinis]|uniref:TNFR-Cys domain-containing protein n=1 Tax=Aldrovandia affinis TaxID=143900 RepID=A0AAD7WA19_9TELE|nr:hypothetical protein AAFF_G00125410 [Aldrovandia affinis]
MEFRRRLCRSLTLFYLFNLGHFGQSSSCSNPPECELGDPAKCKPCPPNKYCDVKIHNHKCAFCTEHCSAERHLTQVKDCTDYSNRECHCDRGFYCDLPIQFTCRRCKPCHDGSFSSNTSRATSCLNHTNCTSLGLAMISKGNRTHDQVCGNVATGPKPETFNRDLESETVTAAWDTQTARRSHAARALTNPGFTNSELSLSVSASVKAIEYRAPRSSWLLVMLLLGLPQDCVVLETVQQLASQGSPGPRALGREGAEQNPGGVQQVNVEYTGGKENVNNTVGSIFIYSPGMVILGANASEQKGEAEEKQEDGERAEERRALISTPQQETQEGDGGPGSRNGVPEGGPVRGGVQEAERKELCYPIPATGKSKTVPILEGSRNPHTPNIKWDKRESGTRAISDRWVDQEESNQLDEPGLNQG